MLSKSYFEVHYYKFVTHTEDNDGKVLEAELMKIHFRAQKSNNNLYDPFRKYK